MKNLSRALLAALLPAAFAAASPAALAQQEQARVIASSPLRNADGSTSYSVTYEYAGRQYTTRTDGPPGDTIPLQISPLGVTTSIDPPQAQAPVAADNSAAPWQNAVPEPGVVVSGDAAAPAVGYGQPVYVNPAPVYVAPPYGYGYGYGYGYPYAYPPVGVSLNLGYVYSRGWGGGGYRRGWR